MHFIRYNIQTEIETTNSTPLLKKYPDSPGTQPKQQARYSSEVLDPT